MTRARAAVMWLREVTRSDDCLKMSSTHEHDRPLTSAASSPTVFFTQRPEIHPVSQALNAVGALRTNNNDVMINNEACVTCGTVTLLQLQCADVVIDTLMFTAQLFSLCALSAHGDAARQPGGLHVLVLRGLPARHRLRPGHPLVHTLHTVLFRLLVQTPVWSVQVNNSAASASAFQTPPCCVCSLPSSLLFVRRSDSSFRFFLFFFVYICQFGIYVIQCIGITGWGTR